MKTAKKRVVKVASMKARAKVPADKVVRVARMEAYMKRTHHTFLVNLKMADELQFFSSWRSGRPGCQASMRLIK